MATGGDDESNMPLSYLLDLNAGVEGIMGGGGGGV